jgi:hypothetical protein
MCLGISTLRVGENKKFQLDLSWVLLCSLRIKQVQQLVHAVWFLGCGEKKTFSMLYGVLELWRTLQKTVHERRCAA